MLVLQIVTSVLITLIIAILIYAATRPNIFRVQRSTQIKAPPARIFELINDFHKWPAWSPYEKLDPHLNRTYSGPESGTGTVYEWNGNKKAGSGRSEIIGTTVPSKVTIKLDFFKPFEAHNTVEFTMQDNGTSTDVTWAMHGPSPFMMKVMSLFLNLDQLVGKEFEEGLAFVLSITER